ncbi:sodium-dependent bicarbonate transport family permease [Inhella gelatinilytica]|uniref:Sodium-dependent bicarbonate transport family permease n=1 Tax=Inhella gelatinilytica TaxID=2795030 RepID=A0A931NCD4_9BURK|nr:sodium-dependent bicarbonate transport family permease [Inhella gelatinilytica]MBH9551449.1 sodium-dependent bicarbonate transport family permease [Inhella gelatinilytica]
MLDVVVFFFVLGVFARVVKSDLRLPEALYETLTIYLLLAIGLKGGLELSRQPLMALAPQVGAVMLLGALIPLGVSPLLRLAGLRAVDAAGLAAHYGSVSVVTFAVGLAAVQRAGLPHESHAALWVAVMEAPGLVVGIVLARLAMGREGGSPLRWGLLAHEVLLGKSVLLLLGGLLIGAVAGDAGVAPIKAVFVDPFKGVLALFLLELGLVAGGQIPALRKHGMKLVLLGCVLPPLLALAGAATGWLLGLQAGGVALLATLAASASYIAAPAAVRVAVPQANTGLAIACALGVTFPFNLLIGIPLYLKLAQSWTP